MLTSQLVVKEKPTKATKHRLPLMQHPQPDVTAATQQDTMQLDTPMPHNTTQQGGGSTGAACSTASEQHQAAAAPGAGVSAGNYGQGSKAGRSSGPTTSQAAQHSKAHAGSRQLGGRRSPAADSSSGSTNAQPYLQHLLLDAIATKLAATGESVLKLLQ